MSCSSRPISSAITLHVRDVADAFLFALENFDRIKNQPYNVGLSEAKLSKRELCEEISPANPRLRVFGVGAGRTRNSDYIVSNAKIEAAGFKACQGPAGGDRRTY